MTEDTKQITLECLMRAPDVVEHLQDYDNDFLYYLNDKRLELGPSLQVRNHSPSGFRHGYEGSGPAQLALAVCLELYSQPVAKAVYQHFKREYIAPLPVNEEFNKTLSVPADPLKYWKIPSEAVDWPEPPDLTPLTEDEEAEERELQKEKTHWQQKLDAAYQQCLRLPGDRRFDFKGGWNMPSFCFIRILNPIPPDMKVTVIATDPGDDLDVGTSITNAAEDLAMQVCREFNIPPEQLRWIERYVDKPGWHAFKYGKGQIKERWDAVAFDREGNHLSNPDWKPLNTKMTAYYKERCQDRQDSGPGLDI